MTKTLTDKQLEQYGRDGFLSPIDVFTLDEVAQYRNAFDSFVANCGEDSHKRFDRLHLFFDWAHRLITEGALLDVIGDVLGDDIFVYGTLVFNKPPLDLSYVPWHQDSVYSGLHLTPSTSAWIALTPSHKSNGCMHVIPGSQKLGLLEHENVRDDPNLLVERGERVKMDVDESQAVDLILRPGQMSLHQSTIIHGSNPNSSDEPRIGFIVRFVTSRMKNPNTLLMRVRGNAECSHLHLANPPPKLDQEGELAAWRGDNVEIA